MRKRKRNTTNEEILSATRKLLAEKGYNNVSLRDIAKELKISVGNLNYHYPKKEDLLEAVVLEKHSRYAVPSPARSLKDLQEILTRTKEYQEQHLYYFRQYSRFSQLSPQIAQVQRKISEDSYALWRDSLSNLRDCGILHEEGYEGQYPCFIKTVLFLLVHWHERDFTDVRLGTRPPDLIHCIWSMLFPMLTAKGREHFFAELRPTLRAEQLI